MSATNDLVSFSDALVELVKQAATGVVAVKAAPYRVVSGLSLRQDLIAVANHTLRRADRVPVESIDGARGVASILGRDPRLDVALLRVEDFKLKPLTVADPAGIKPGMLAAVVGLTVDVGPSTSLGIFGAVGGPRPTWRGATLDYFFRLDVNVYPSQTGAAVVNSEGRLVGMATPALLRHSSVAVPVATLERIANELLQQGRIRHGYLGVGLQTVAIPVGLREKLGTQQASGLIILSVEDDSPACKAGLELGDILLSLDAKPLADTDDLQNELRGERVGQTVTLVLLRGGERTEKQIAISERVKRTQE